MTPHNHLIPPLIKARELKNLSPNNFILVDTSFGKATYEAQHLEGAIYIDLNSQLSDIKPDASEGGRHPLPTIQQFSERLGQWGITPESHVIIYDNKNGAMSAARFWWMLKAIGHEKVQVLDGGIQAAIQEGFSTSTNYTALASTKPYPIGDWQLPTVDIDEVEIAASSINHIVVDVREADRYLGKTEPIDLVAGHIPGAINIPFAENLESNGQFKSPEVLHEKYQTAFGQTQAKDIIVHCGSGVTACHTLLAMAHAGMDIPNLYVGSWSEWSRNGKPIGIGRDN